MHNICSSRIQEQSIRNIITQLFLYCHTAYVVYVFTYMDCSSRIQDQSTRNMYVCIYVCIYIYMHRLATSQLKVFVKQINVHTGIYMYIYIYIYTYAVHAYKNNRLAICMYVSMYAYTYICIDSQHHNSKFL